MKIADRLLSEFDQEMAATRRLIGVALSFGSTSAICAIIDNTSPSGTAVRVGLTTRHAATSLRPGFGKSSRRCSISEKTTALLNHESGGLMARRPNYGFEKRQKELDRQKKKEAKAERKQVKREENARGADEVPSDEPAEGTGPDTGTPGDHEHPHRLA